MHFDKPISSDAPFVSLNIGKLQKLNRMHYIHAIMQNEFSIRDSLLRVCKKAQNRKILYMPISGLQLRRIHISISDRDSIDSKLWLSGDSEVSTLLWQDPNQISWSPGTAYKYIWFF